MWAEDYATSESEALPASQDDSPILMSKEYWRPKIFTQEYMRIGGLMALREIEKFWAMKSFEPWKVFISLKKFERLKSEREIDTPPDSDILMSKQC